jgi:hypothetical protein
MVVNFQAGGIDLVAGRVKLRSLLPSFTRRPLLSELFYFQ